MKSKTSALVSVVALSMCRYLIAMILTNGIIIVGNVNLFGRGNILGHKKGRNSLMVITEVKI